MDVENDYWKQCSRSNWLLQSDRNTAYFHHRANHRHCTNRIHRIHIGPGCFVTSQTDISGVVVKNFAELFTTEHTKVDFDHIFSSISIPQMSAADHAMVDVPFTQLEIWTALNNMDPTKAPGPDEFHTKFFQTQWRTVGSAISKVLLGCLNDGDHIGMLNDTFITLIPKTKNPKSMVDFRLISLCNLVYKILSKVLVNYIKPILNCLIGEEQSAFVSNRLITNNIIIASKVFL